MISGKILSYQTRKQMLAKVPGKLRIDSGVRRHRRIRQTPHEIRTDVPRQVVNQRDMRADARPLTWTAAFVSCDRHRVLAGRIQMQMDFLEGIGGSQRPAAGGFPGWKSPAPRRFASHQI